MTNGSRNRSAGHNWEREVVAALKQLGFNHVSTSRNESRLRDAQKIDIVNINELKNGRLPYNIQAKCVVGHLKYGLVLSELPKEDDITNVILHKQTIKRGSRFITSDKFAILYMDDFFKMVKKIKDYESASSK